MMKGTLVYTILGFFDQVLHAAGLPPRLSSQPHAAAGLNRLGATPGYQDCVPLGGVRVHEVGA